MHSSSVLPFSPHCVLSPFLSLHFSIGLYTLFHFPPLSHSISTAFHLISLLPIPSLFPLHFSTFPNLSSFSTLLLISSLPSVVSHLLPSPSYSTQDVHFLSISHISPQYLFPISLSQRPSDFIYLLFASFTLSLFYSLRSPLNSYFSLLRPVTSFISSSLHLHSHLTLFPPTLYTHPIPSSFHSLPLSYPTPYPPSSSS